MDRCTTITGIRGAHAAGALLVTASLLLAACGGGGGGSSTPHVTVTPTPTPSPTPFATPTIASPNAAVAYTCPPSDTVLNSAGRANGGDIVDAVHRSNGIRVKRAPSSTATGFLAVTYSNATASGSRATALAAREQATGGTLVHQLAFAHIGKIIHVLSVPVAQMSAITAKLLVQPGVESVAPTGMRRYVETVNAGYFPNDPYFNGFTLAQNLLAGSSAAATKNVPPYYESSQVPGQWDMHAIKLEDAFAYSLSTNGSNVAPNPGALGSASVNIAIIDTGEDPNNPELQSKIVRQRCFITNAAGTAQSTSNFETDALGHGTNVSGIAAADTNNAFGFTGAGGNVSIFGYRVFPTPDDNCVNENTTDPQCETNTIDIADAIQDAVSAGANVISISLGGDVCSSPGVDSDTMEGTAVADAIAAGVIVVAASGNSGGSGVSAPACDTGVIAVGASALADGAANPNGSGNSLGSPGAPVEYVASYTQYGTVNGAQNPNAWGIVAPGGDAILAGTDNDNLHWIENIWTTTPYESSSSDTNFQGSCYDDYPNSGSTVAPVDCRVLIEGTSMATPHVAGAAALILSATGGSASPYKGTAMKTLLCLTADDLGGTSTAIQGCGRLNVYNAMAKALADSSPPVPIP